MTARIDLFWRFKGTMTSDLSFRAAGPIWDRDAYHAEWQERIDQAALVD